MYAKIEVLGILLGLMFLPLMSVSAQSCNPAAVNYIVRDEKGNVLKTVFIKAPRNIGYGNVVKVIDAAKMAGAEPMALQIDYLE